MWEILTGGRNARKTSLPGDTESDDAIATPLSSRRVKSTAHIRSIGTTSIAFQDLEISSAIDEEGAMHEEAEPANEGAAESFEERDKEESLSRSSVNESDGTGSPTGNMAGRHPSLKKPRVSKLKPLILSMTSQSLTTVGPRNPHTTEVEGCPTRPHHGGLAGARQDVPLQQVKVLPELAGTQHQAYQRGAVQVGTSFSPVMSPEPHTGPSLSCHLSSSSSMLGCSGGSKRMTRSRCNLQTFLTTTIQREWRDMSKPWRLPFRSSHPSPVVSAVTSPVISPLTCHVTRHISPDTQSASIAGSSRVPRN